MQTESGEPLHINQFRVPGMTNQSDMYVIRQALERLTGVVRVEANIAQQTVRVEHDDQVSVAILMNAIHSAGYHQLAVLA